MYRISKSMDWVDEPKIARRETRPTTATRYAVILAPGYYGDYTLVRSAHRTLQAARRAARPTSHVHYIVIALPGAHRGDRVYSDFGRAAL